MFGKKGGGGGNDGGGGNGPRLPQIDFNPKFLGGGVGLLAALAVVIWLASGFYIVDASQRGIVLQFGSYKETTEPGLRWRFPYPIQSVESGQSDRRANGRNRLSRQRAQQGAERGADADR